MVQQQRTFAFIDASNLFYGGEKSLGWSIDYEKLFKYLRQKYAIDTAFYFGGVETHGFRFDYLEHDTVPILDLERYVTTLIRERGEQMIEGSLILLTRHLRRIRFYRHLQEFGYTLRLKPVKRYDQEDGTIRRKANCDVDMTYVFMKEQDNFDRAIVLSGDGDFLPVLKHLRLKGREVIILSRGPRTAREIRQFAGSNFCDFVRLERYVKFEQNKRDGHAKYPPHV